MGKTLKGWGLIALEVSLWIVGVTTFVLLGSVAVLFLDAFFGVPL